MNAHATSLNRLALSATLHCLTGCSIGEVLGMALGAGLHWSNGLTIAVSVALAFVFGYAFTLKPLLGSRLPLATALPLALASDTLSITIMEIVDNAIMLVIPGAMDAHLTDPLLWGSLVLALGLAGLAAYPANRWLILRGQGHALVHAQHAGHGSGHGSDAAPPAGGHEHPPSPPAGDRRPGAHHAHH